MHTFPEKVSIDYYDAALLQVQEQFAVAIEEAKIRYWPFPLVLVDGQIAMAGDVNVYRLSRLVDQRLSHYAGDI
jgi:disulfide oxidoreductase YuzD